MPPEHPFASGLIADIGEALLVHGFPDEARQHLEAGLSHVEGAASPDPSDLAKIRFALARALTENGDPPRAIELGDAAYAGFVAAGDVARADEVNRWRRGGEPVGDASD